MQYSRLFPLLLQFIKKNSKSHVTNRKQNYIRSDKGYFEIQLARDEGGSPPAPSYSQIGNISPAQFFPSNASTRLGTVALFFLFFFRCLLAPFQRAIKDWRMEERQGKTMRPTRTPFTNHPRTKEHQNREHYLA